MKREEGRGFRSVAACGPGGIPQKPRSWSADLTVNGALGLQVPPPSHRTGPWTDTPLDGPPGAQTDVNVGLSGGRA